MFGKLLFLFIAVPLIEIALLIKLGSTVGFWPTILIQVGTGILGASLAKIQGLFVWQKIAREMQSGKIPTEDMINGVLILAAGVVLMTPGLLTDLCGFALLVPTTRNGFKRWVRKQLENRMGHGKENISSPF